MANSIATGVAYADPAFTSVQVGTSTTPITLTSSGVLNGSYAKTSAASGDTRLAYQKLTFTSTGSGETLRSFTVVSGANAGTGGTVNGAHISMEVQGGSISGAGNALRATIGGTTAAPGGTLAALQVDTNFSSGVTLPGSAAFIRASNSNTTTMTNLLNLPAAMVAALGGTSATPNRKIACVTDAGTTFYLMAVV